VPCSILCVTCESPALSLVPAWLCCLFYLSTPTTLSSAFSSGFDLSCNRQKITDLGLLAWAYQACRIACVAISDFVA
jgi:hypothetical protein